MIIEDGAGSGKHAQVDSTNKLNTRSITETAQREAALNGVAYLLHTGFVTLTNTTQTAIFYLKNDEDKPIIITRLLVLARASTGGSGTHAVATLWSNPTGMSGGTSNSLTQTNVNFGSSNTLDSTSTIGQAGATLTGGTSLGGLVVPLQNMFEVESSIILPKGASIGGTITAPSGNTSLQVGYRINVHITP